MVIVVVNIFECLLCSRTLNMLTHSVLTSAYVEDTLLLHVI